MRYYDDDLAPTLPPGFNTLPLSDLDKIGCADSFLDAICNVCTFFFSELTSPHSLLISASS